MKRILAAAAACLLFCAGSTACAAEPEDEASFRIVTSFYPMYIICLNITEGIDGVSLENMAGQQTGCLHDYQLQSKDRKNLERADAFVINGAGMESFLDDVVASLPSLTVVDASEGLAVVEENPHLWVSVSNCIRQVENVAGGLAAADPAHAAQYRANAEIYVEKLEALREEMHEAIDPLPNRRIVTFHEAFPYFAEEFGLEIAAVVNREPDSQPSARELANTIRLIRETGVTAVFAEPQYPESAANILAEESGATLYFLDPCVTGEDDPDAYLDAMRENKAVLQEALS